jgi:hypothetical protein
MVDDEDRDAIFARRARLIAAALAGIGAVVIGACSDAQPCLQPGVTSATTGAGGMGGDGGAGDGGSGGDGGSHQ